jgi:hypothetical protein
MKTSEQRIEHIVKRMLADRLQDAPADAIKWAKDLYRTRVVAKPAGLLQRIVAVITADIAPGQLAFGERSGSAGQARQILFEAGENAVDLRITSANGKFDIRGQILGDGFENADIELASGDTKFTAKADEMSTFSFGSVSAGDYSLTVSNDSAEIVIEQLTLK